MVYPQIVQALPQPFDCYCENVALQSILLRQLTAPPANAKAAAVCFFTTLINGAHYLLRVLRVLLFLLPPQRLLRGGLFP